MSPRQHWFGYLPDFGQGPQPLSYTGSRAEALAVFSASAHRLAVSAGVHQTLHMAVTATRAGEMGLLQYTLLLPGGADRASAPPANESSTAASSTPQPGAAAAPLPTNPSVDAGTGTFAMDTSDSASAGAQSQPPPTTLAGIVADATARGPTPPPQSRPPLLPLPGNPPGAGPSQQQATSGADLSLAPGRQAPMLSPFEPPANDHLLTTSRREEIMGWLSNKYYLSELLRKASAPEPPVNTTADAVPGTRAVTQFEVYLGHKIPKKRLPLGAADTLRELKTSEAVVMHARLLLTILPPLPPDLRTHGATSSPVRVMLWHIPAPEAGVTPRQAALETLRGLLLSQWHEALERRVQDHLTPNNIIPPVRGAQLFAVNLALPRSPELQTHLQGGGWLGDLRFTHTGVMARLSHSSNLFFQRILALMNIHTGPSVPMNPAIRFLEQGFLRMPYRPVLYADIYNADVTDQAGGGNAQSGSSGKGKRGGKQSNASRRNDNTPARVVAAPINSALNFGIIIEDYPSEWSTIWNATDPGIPWCFEGAFPTRLTVLEPDLHEWDRALPPGAAGMPYMVADTATRFPIVVLRAPNLDTPIDANLDFVALTAQRLQRMSPLTDIPEIVDTECIPGTPYRNPQWLLGHFRTLEDANQFITNFRSGDAYPRLHAYLGQAQRPMALIMPAAQFLKLPLKKIESALQTAYPSWPPREPGTQAQRNNRGQAFPASSQSPTPSAGVGGLDLEITTPGAAAAAADDTWEVIPFPAAGGPNQLVRASHSAVNPRSTGFQGNAPTITLSAVQSLLEMVQTKNREYVDEQLAQYRRESRTENQMQTSNMIQTALAHQAQDIEDRVTMGVAQNNKALIETQITEATSQLRQQTAQDIAQQLPLQVANSTQQIQMQLASLRQEMLTETQAAKAAADRAATNVPDSIKGVLANLEAQNHLILQFMQGQMASQQHPVQVPPANFPNPPPVLTPPTAPPPPIEASRAERDRSPGNKRHTTAQGASSAKRNKESTVRAGAAAGTTSTLAGTSDDGTGGLPPDRMPEGYRSAGTGLVNIEDRDQTLPLRVGPRGREALLNGTWVPCDYDDMDTDDKAAASNGNGAK